MIASVTKKKRKPKEIIFNMLDLLNMMGAGINLCVSLLYTICKGFYLINTMKTNKIEVTPLLE